MRPRSPALAARGLLETGDLLRVASSIAAVDITACSRAADTSSISPEPLARHQQAIVPRSLH